MFKTYSDLIFALIFYNYPNSCECYYFELLNIYLSLFILITDYFNCILKKIINHPTEQLTDHLNIGPF